MSRAGERRRIREQRRTLLKRALWLAMTVIVAGTLGSWLWAWTGTPVFLE